MAWTKKRDPRAPAPPAFHHPRRCMRCGHLDAPDLERNIHEAHDPDVGCLVEGGTKYLEDEHGVGRYACSCEQFEAVPEEVITNA